MKRILIISSDYEPFYGGIGIHVKNLTDELVKQGCRVTLLIGRMKTSREYAYTSEALYSVTLDTEERKIVEINTDFEQMLSKEERKILSVLEEKDVFDYETAILNQLFLKGAIAYLGDSGDSYALIHLHDAFISFGAVMLGRYLRIPVIVTMHSMNSGEGWLIDNVRRYLVNNVDRILCVSDFIRNEIMHRFCFKDETKLLTVHNSVKLAVRNRETPILPNGEIVFCGRIEEVKGADLLIRAVSLLPQAYREKVNLTIIGTGSIEEQLKSLCEELYVQEQVTFTGLISQEQVFRYYERAMCVVFPSRKEAFSTAALEAMSIGCCVVASDVGGFTEFIHDGENGFLFEADNVQELTRRLAYIFEHIETANKMGKSAQSKVMEEYLWENTAKKICEIYEEINTTYNLRPKCSH